MRRVCVAGLVCSLAGLFLVFFYVIFDDLQAQATVLSRHIILKANPTQMTAEFLEFIPDGLDLAVTTLVLNQGRYLREWIEFHRIMGFQFFLIFDHGSSDNTRQVLQEYIACGIVLLIDAVKSFKVCGTMTRSARHVQSPCQNYVFNSALGLFRDKVAWLGNFDVDEFMWTPRDAVLNLTTLLHSYKQHYQHVHVVGVVYGTNNLTQPTSLPVIQAFTNRTQIDPGVSDHGPDYARKMLYQPSQTWWVGVHSAVCWLCTALMLQPLAPELRFNHYQWKSREEQVQKAVLNGNPVIAYDSRTEAHWNAVKDEDITYVLPALLPRLQGQVQCLPAQFKYSHWSGTSTTKGSISESFSSNGSVFGT
jgi:hypothetical protein